MANENEVRDPYILWCNYGLEGWAPRGYDTEQAMVEAIAEGLTHGNPFVITRRLDLAIKQGDTK